MCLPKSEFLESFCQLLTLILREVTHISLEKCIPNTSVARNHKRDRPNGGARFQTSRFSIFMLPSRKNKLIAGFVAGLVLLLGVAWYDWRHAVRIQDLGAAVARTHEMQGSLVRLLLLIEDIETGARGYVITGEPAYLEPFETSLGKVKEQLQSVRGLTRENLGPQSDYDVLTSLISQRIEVAEGIVELRRSKSFEVARKEVAEGKGKDLMARIRAVIAGMEAKGRGAAG